MSDFTLGDFRKLLGQTKRLGPLNKIMSLLPGMGGMANMQQMLADADAEGEMQRLGESSTQKPSTLDCSPLKLKVLDFGNSTYDIDVAVLGHRPGAALFTEPE